MSDKEVQEVSTEDVESTAVAKKSQERKPNKYVEKWENILLGSSNTMSTDDKAFSDPYSKCRDALVPRTNGYDLFMYLFCNRVERVPICNPWVRNFAKLIVPDVFVDVDLMKELIKAYNLITKGFHRHDGSILCIVDRNTLLRHSAQRDK